jgi:serine/threonine protein kinase
MSRALSWTDFDLAERLGDGHSATVLRATMRRDVGELRAGAAVAVKRYRPWVLQQSGQIERIFREVNAGRSVQHPNLMKVYGAVLDGDGHPALVMKLYAGVTLEEYRAWLFNRVRRPVATWMQVDPLSKAVSAKR